LSPVWLAGLAAGAIPPAPFQPLLGAVLRALGRRHPEVFARLAPLGGRSVLIAPTDLPFRCLLRPNDRPPSLRVLAVDEAAAENGSATIRGPLLKLLALAEGRVDGDALFFSRDISVSGDTEVVVALRNARSGAAAGGGGGTAGAAVRRAVGRPRRARGAPSAARAARGPADSARRAGRGREGAGMSAPRLELVCPAGTPAALHSAVDAGADAVYLGLRDETNARNFPGLNFAPDELRDAVAYARPRGCRVFVAINTFPAAGRPEPWRRAVDLAAELGVDAVILADVGLLDYAARRYPELRRHLSVQASASNPEAIHFYREAFGVRRVVLPRVLTLPEIAALNAQIPVETEVFAFGGMCVMAEGRCSLSSYATGQSPNTCGVCSPASHVRYETHEETVVTRLGAFTIDAFAPGAPVGYPALCKGRFRAGGREDHLFEEPTSLNVLGLLPELAAAGVRALKIEGRQRGRAYVGQVVAAFRRAVDAAARGDAVAAADLSALAEGGRGSAGAYLKAWR